MKKMKEKEIKTEKVEKKKVYRKPKKVIEETKVKDDEINNMILNSGEVYQNVIKTPKQAGYYRVGKSFNIFFEKKPCGFHRFFSKILLGWNWFDQK